MKSVVAQRIRPRATSMNATMTCYQKSVTDHRYIAFLKHPIVGESLTGRSRTTSSPAASAIPWPADCASFATLSFDPFGAGFRRWTATFRSHVMRC